WAATSTARGRWAAVSESMGPPYRAPADALQRAAGWAPPAQGEHMPRLVRVFLGIGVAILVLLGGAWVWISWTASSALAKTYTVHAGDCPIPMPLTPAEVAALPADPAAPPPDLDALARERAIARGDHLVHGRYVCVECHGQNFGGGTMVDDPMIGTVHG